MAKKNKPNTSTEPTTSTPVANTPQTPLGVLQAGVRKAERAFLVAIENNGDGSNERAALVEAKHALAAFMANRLPIAAKAFVGVIEANGGDITTPEAIAAITELRSALSGIAKPAVAAAVAAVAATV